MLDLSLFIRHAKGKLILVRLCFLHLLLWTTQLISIHDLRTFIQDTISLRADGKIAIPSHIKHIKLDIDLSYSAPLVTILAFT
jgi:hypothetical protein